MVSQPPVHGKCWAHVLNNVMKQMLHPPKKAAQFDAGLSFNWKSIVKKMKKCVTWTRKSSKGFRVWSKSCDQVNLPPRKLYSPIPTRFGSVIIMITQLLKYKDAIQLCYSRNEKLADRIPTAFEWQLAEKVIGLCLPIFKICILNQSKSSWIASDALRYNMQVLKHLTEAYSKLAHGTGTF
jgi:hypothetical protein